MAVDGQHDAANSGEVLMSLDYRYGIVDRKRYRDKRLSRISHEITVD